MTKDSSIISVTKHALQKGTTAKMKSVVAVAAVLASLFSSTQALYFYIDGATPKCFYEDLPKDTLVVGQFERIPIPSSLGSTN